MYPLFESIKVVDGVCQNLKWHQKRLDQSRRTVFGSRDILDLQHSIEIPPQFVDGVVKCRVSYGEILGPITFSHYSIKKVSTLQQIECEPFDYRVKYQDRNKLDKLYQLRGSCNDILITINGRITDTSYSNVALFDGSQWYTSERPLLEGTHRARLLASGVLEVSDLQVNDLVNFEKLILLNAMLEFRPETALKIDQIKPWDQSVITF